MGLRVSSRVGDDAALRDQVARLLRDYRQPVLVEEFCPGPEFTVGVLGTGDSAAAIGVMEIAPRDRDATDFVYSIEVKRMSEAAVEYRVPRPSRRRWSKPLPISPLPLIGLWGVATWRESMYVSTGTAGRHSSRRTRFPASVRPGATS